MEPIFVAGCGRSGTTLLATLLAAHSRVVAPPEAPFVAEALVASRRGEGEDAEALARAIGASWRYRLWDLPADLPARLAATSSSPAELVGGLAEAFARKVSRGDADRWVDHTPVNVGYAPSLLAEFGAAPMVHIVRDPRAVIASVLPLDWGPASAREGARWWLSRVGMGLAAEAAFPDRVVRVSYEDLVRDPAATLGELCPRIGLEFEPSMVESSGARLPSYTQEQHALVGRPPDPSRIDAWRGALSPAQVATIEGELREAPAMLGYPAAASPSADGRSALEFAGTALRTARQRWRHRARVRRALKQRGAGVAH